MKPFPLASNIARLMLVSSICGAMLCGVLHGNAQSPSAWPAGPVTIVASTPVGTRQDIATRLIADALSGAYKQSFVIENRPGGNGIIAARDVAHARPDGQTLLSSGNSPIAANPHLFKSLPYDPEKDFTAIAMITDGNPLVLAVNASIPVNNIAEYVAYAKAHSGQLSNAGFGQLSWIMGSVLDKAAGIETLQVRYTSLAPSLTDTIEGRTTSTITTLDSVEPYVATGKLKIIVTVGRERFPTIPDVPALEEIYPGIAMEGWFVLLGPAGMPKDVVDKINTTTNAFVKQPDTQKRMLALGSIVHGDKTPEQVAAFMRDESERWGKVLSGLGIEPQ
jgi:tripartite-type tricarboxylate transporter receptor subunit TctC